MVVYLSASNNNRSETVFELFVQATNMYNLPSRVRSDMGLENIDVARYMIQMRGSSRGSILTGNSVHNQRIERFWREVNRIIVSRFLNIFLYLETRGVFSGDNEAHLYCLHIVYLPLINNALGELTSQWNDHPVTTSTNFSPRQMWVQGMLELRNSNLTAVRDVIDGDVNNMEELDIDEGSLPNTHPGLVTVPQSSLQLTHEEEEIVQQAVSSVPSDNNGITAYMAALSALYTIIGH